MTVFFVGAIDANDVGQMKVVFSRTAPRSGSDRGCSIAGFEMEMGESRMASR